MTKGRFAMHRSRIAGIEAVEAVSGHSFQRHTHSQYGVGVIHRGAQKSLSGRGMVEAGAGDVITVNPNEVHDGSPIGDHGRTWSMLYFEPSLVAPVIGEVADGRSLSEIPRPVFSDAALAAQFRALFSAVIADGAGDGLDLEERLLALFAGVMRETTTLTEKIDVRAISNARQRIDDDPLAPLTLEDLSRASGLSRFQLVRGFARVTGLTPHAYLVQRRIDIARRMLAGGSAIAEAAVASGFADQSHMTRVFVRKYGISPGLYAKAFG